MSKYMYEMEQVAMVFEWMRKLKELYNTDNVRLSIREDGCGSVEVFNRAWSGHRGLWSTVYSFDTIIEFVKCIETVD